MVGNMPTMPNLDSPSTAPACYSSWSTPAIAEIYNSRHPTLFHILAAVNKAKNFAFPSKRIGFQ